MAEMYDELNQNPGIDTEQERARINYKPIEQLTEKERKVIIETKTTPDESEIIIRDDYPISDLSDQLDELYENIQELKTIIEAQIRDIKIDLTKEYPEAVTVATLLGIKPPILTADVYKGLLLQEQSPETEYLMDIWESEAEDVGGTLAMEYYEDVLEIEKDFNLSLEFINETIFHDTNIDYEVGVSQSKVLSEAERVLYEERKKLKEQEEKLEEEIRTATIYRDPKRLAELKDDSRKLKQLLTALELQETIEEEGYETISGKMGYQYMNIRTMKRNLSKELYASGTYLKKMFPYHENEQELKDSMQKAKGLLKVSVDKQNTDKQKKKEVIRQHLSIDKRKRVQNNVLDHIDMTKSWSSQWKQLLLEQDEADEEQEMFFESLAVGMKETFDKRYQMMQEYYTVSLEEGLNRNDKIKGVFQKEKAREGYKQVKNLIDNL